MKNIAAFIFALMISVSSFSQSISIKHIDPAVSSISKQEVYWIYTLKTRFWPDGTKIIVYYLDFDSATHANFCREVLNTSVHQFKNSIDVYVNIGNSAYFRKASSEQDVFDKVSRTPGAVGYISEKTLLINDGGKNVRKINIVN